jgi:glycosyltransferase involved in cell wall biosynthesis
VVTASYNMAQFLGQAVESVLRQTHGDFQYVVIDDGSTDNSRDIVRPFLTDGRVEYHYQSNQGQTVAKNAGLARATGEYVCFLDGDNYWEPGKLARQLEVFSMLPDTYGIVYTDQLYVDERGTVTGRPTLATYSGRISDQLLFDNFVTFNTAMVRRRCFEEMGPFDESLQRSIDYELWLRFSTRYEFQYIPEITCYYRRWSGQMSQDLRRRYAVAMFIMDRFLEQNPKLVGADVVRSARRNAYRARGGYFASLGDWGEAAPNYLRALRHGPVDLRTWRSIARSLLRSVTAQKTV